MKSSDHPFMQTVEKARQTLRQIPGSQLFQKFTCHHCKSRQTIDEPNTFYTHGTCQECGHLTDIFRSGTNYLLACGVPSNILPRAQHLGIKVIVSEPYQSTNFPPKEHS